MNDQAEHGPVDVTFVSGRERGFRYPPQISQAALDHRLAVVQHTHVSGWPDMVFDQTLWQAICEFLRLQGIGQVLVGNKDEDLGKHEVALPEFLADQDRLPDEDRAPPGLLVVRSGGRLRLCVVTEYWADVGGPDRYHDSYTYSVFSGFDLTGALPAFLRERSAGRWVIADEVTRATP